MAEPATLHAQLYDTMLHRIRSGIWAAGEKVPSERSLIAEFGVSRGPVRQALAALRTEGLISGGRGTPPRVQRVAPAQSFATFMPFSEWALSLGLTPGQRVIEASRRPASEQIAAELRIEPLAPVVEIIRVRLLNGRPTMLERSAVPYAIGKHVLAADLDASSAHHGLEYPGATAIRARHVIDAVAAPPLDVEALNVAPGAPLLRVRRLSYNEFGEVIETADERYVPDLATVVVENLVEGRTPLTRASGLPTRISIEKRAGDHRAAANAAAYRPE